MNTSEVKISLRKFTLEHEKKVIELAKQVYQEDLVPYLQLGKYSFTAGMGSWAVWDERGNYISRDKLPKHLYNKLSSDVHYSDNDLGSLMMDYPLGPQP